MFLSICPDKNTDVEQSASFATSGRRLSADEISECLVNLTTLHQNTA
jgi:hypothetical protein